MRSTIDHQPFTRRARRIESLRQRINAVEAERYEMRDQLLARLGLSAVHPLETQGFESLDLLSMLRVEGDHWIWTAGTNQAGSAVTYPHLVAKRGYFGAAKLVHAAVVGCQHQGAYHPRCSERLCMRPSHRCSTCEAAA